MRHAPRSYLPFFLIIVTIFLLSPACASSQPAVLVVDLSDTITPASDDIIKEALATAEGGEFEALIITLNTPGGGLDETLTIIEDMQQSSVPVIGYVYPAGTKAWSAGTLILISTDIAAMAPHTIIGSAQPVSMSAGGIEPIEDDKIVNALVERATENARMHGRNVTATERFITENLNLNAQDALEFGVIEFVASDIEDLLNQVDGQIINDHELDTSGAEIIFHKPSLGLSIMDIISDPIISSLLMMLGIYGIVLGISNPGFGAEIFGVIAITLGLIGMGFDVNIAALFLIGVGVVLMVLELQAPGFGVLGIAGVVCLMAGSIFLIPMDFPRWYTPADVQQSMIFAVVVPTVIVGLFFAFALYKVIEVRHRKPVIGEDPTGDIAEAIDPIGPDRPGYVRYKGEYWKTRSEDDIEVGDRVEITGKDGPVLLVKMSDEQP
ncbi:MAG: nodulation protein NfeD [Methanosarcinaceae archaeon]|nr:nodulation protein NfeD [Methanosarcinaceae archaeon]